jgi:hypothetical protein
MGVPLLQGVALPLAAPSVEDAEPEAQAEALWPSRLAVGSVVDDSVPAAREALLLAEAPRAAPPPELALAGAVSEAQSEAVAAALGEALLLPPPPPLALARALCVLPPPPPLLPVTVLLGTVLAEALDALLAEGRAEALAEEDFKEGEEEALLPTLALALALPSG